MLSINLYQPGGIDKEIPFPEEWNELATPEIEGIAKVMLSGFDDIHLIKAAFFKEILQHRYNTAKKSFTEKLLDLVPGPKYNIYDQLNPEDSVINGLPLIEFILGNNELTRQPYPFLVIDGKKFYGPVSDFDNLQCGEYEDADIPYLRFQEAKDPLYLAEMAAILYRPKNTPYIIYNAQRDHNEVYPAEKYTSLFEKLPPWQLYSIFMWWTGCKTVMQNIFSYVYEKGSEGAELDYMVFTKCIHSAAGPKNGNRNQVRNNEIKAIMFDMNEEAKKAKELEKSYTK